MFKGLITVAQERCKSCTNTRGSLLFGPLRRNVFVIAQAVHDRGVLGEDNGCRRSLRGDVVWGHSVNVVRKEASQTSVPLRSKEPWCSKRKSTSNHRSFPKLDRSVDGLEAIGSLGFPHVDGQFAYEVASVEDVFLYLESSKRVGSQVLYTAPKFDTIVKSFASQRRSNLLRCSTPWEFAPK